MTFRQEIIGEAIAFNCPQCGEECEALHEGYCEACCSANQIALNIHNAEFDAWERKSSAERDKAIRDACR